MKTINLKTVNKEILGNVVKKVIESNFNKEFEKEVKETTELVKITEFYSSYVKIMINYYFNPNRETEKEELMESGHGEICKEVCKYYSYKKNVGYGSNGYNILFNTKYIINFKIVKQRFIEKVLKELEFELKKEKVKNLELFVEMFNNNSHNFLNGTYNVLVELLVKNNILTKKDFVRNLEMIKDSFNYYIKKDKKRKEILKDSISFLSFIERNEDNFKIFLTNGLKTIELELKKENFYITSHGNFNFLNKNEIECIIKKEFNIDINKRIYVDNVNSKYNEKGKDFINFTRQKVEVMEYNLKKIAEENELKK